MSFQPILTALQAGVTVITPTHRLQREILWNFVQSQQGDVFIKPECYAFESWLRHWFDNYELSLDADYQKKCMSDAQFQFLAWRLFPRNLSPAELNTWLSAYKNITLAQAKLGGSDFVYQAVAQQFQTSFEQIETYLQEESWLPKPQLASFLAEKKYPRPDARFLFCCFDTLHPQQQTLLDQLADQGHDIQFYDLGLTTSFSTHADCIGAHIQQQDHQNIYHYIADNETTEEDQLILWVLAQVKAGKQRIGIVVPDLSEAKNRLYRRLLSHLPSEILHCSLGHSLIEYPLIHHALVLLFLEPRQRLKHDEIKLILYSPWIAGYATEAQARQNLAQSHKLLQELELPWPAFLAILASTCPILAKVLAKLETYPEQASPKTWLDLFATRLQQLEFAHTEVAHLEVCQKLYLGLESLYELTEFAPRLTQHELKTWLGAKFQQEIHQPPQDYHGVHLMGWLESSGFCGDALWFCHCLSQFIPQPPAFSSWLPIRWQKEHQLPRTSYETEMQIAQALLKRLIQANTVLVFSYPKLIEQQIQWPSPLFPQQTQAYTPLTADFPRQVLETVQDPTFLPLAADETLKGGSQLLASYSNCPFQAFAKYRLHTQAPIEQHFGLDARESGQLMHQALFYFWQHHPDIKQLSAEARDTAIKDCVQQVINQHLTHRPYSLDPLLAELEQEKLRQMLNLVLAFEDQREPFKIFGLEQDLSLEIEGIEFKLRYDRIDQLANGDLLLIDYKSSLPSPLPWRQVEPLHPQILLYALAQSKIQALMFGAISLQDYHVSGISAYDLDIEGIKTTKQPWVELEQQWLTHFRGQIQELKAGRYEIKPANTQTCARCLYQDLCRIED